MLNQLKRIFNYRKLNYPYPYSARFPESLEMIVFISLFIFFFVFFFRSEHFSGNQSTPNKLLTSSYYGFTTFLIASINIFIFSYLIKPEKEQNWKVWNEIALYVIQFVTISMAIHFLSYYVMEKKMSFAGIFQSIFTTTPIGLIPVSIYVLNEQKKLFKKNYELASYISENSQDREVKTHKELINIEGQSYPISEILYFESNKNYINIYTEEDRMFTIRLTMKEMEYLLASYTQFIRCHRAYIVNSDKIVNVEGNAQGLKLFFSKTTSFVPVSRSYISKVDPVIRPNE